MLKNVQKIRWKKTKKKAPAKRAGALNFTLTQIRSLSDQLPQLPELHDPELHPPPPPSGLVEVMEKPERYPASRKSTLITPQDSSKPSSTIKFTPPSSNVLSLSFGSSRANPSEGPAQPPCIKAMRMADSMLFCARYVFKFSTAELVTSNIITSWFIFKLYIYFELNQRKQVKLNTWYYRQSKVVL